MKEEGALHLEARQGRGLPRYSRAAATAPPFPPKPSTATAFRSPVTAVAANNTWREEKLSKVGDGAEQDRSSRKKVMILWTPGKPKMKMVDDGKTGRWQSHREEFMHVLLQPRRKSDCGDDVSWNNEGGEAWAFSSTMVTARKEEDGGDGGELC